MSMKFSFSFLFALKLFSSTNPTTTTTTNEKLPIVINTWNFTNATIEAWNVINNQKKSAVS